MVMAGTESVSGTVVDDSALSRLQWLRQRRDELQDKLSQKNNELKSLCIEEAELTGILPPEIPLDPGEAPPVFHKKVSTALNYSHNLLNKLKTNESEESKLEVERQGQIAIAEAALAVLNNPLENKAVRRKQRSIYQQSQKRIQELDAQLNFIRQSHGSILRHSQSSQVHSHVLHSHLSLNSKQKMKKPRAPSDNSSTDMKSESKSLQDQDGISLSPINSEDSYNSYSNKEYQDFAGHNYLQTCSISTPPSHITYQVGSPIDNRKNINSIERDGNVYNNAYILQEQFRNRSYSQISTNLDNFNQNQFQDRVSNQRPVPNVYTAEERKLNYLKKKIQRQESEEILKNQKKYSDLRHLDNNEINRKSMPIHYEDNDFNPVNYDQFTQNTHRFHNKYQQPVSRMLRDSVILTSNIVDHKTKSAAIDKYIPPGYWVRVGDEVVWCTDQQLNNDKFGSLDRRKHNLTNEHSIKSEIHSRYHTVALGKNSTALPKQYLVQPNASDKNLASNKVLTRTQSLGNVENWHSVQECADELYNDSSRGKTKEKEWIETSLDSTSPVPNAYNSHQGKPFPVSTKEKIQTGREPVRSNSIPSNRRLIREPEVLEKRTTIPQTRFVDNRALEVSADVKLQENGNKTMIPLSSPTNHTVVEPGKYQPYREETKPFEMSDFYKYSTKFRKKQEITSPNEHQNNTIDSNIKTSDDQFFQNNQIQKRVHQPLQQHNFPYYPLR